MVTRKPIPASVVPAPLRQAAGRPPYPTGNTTMPEEPPSRPSFEHVDSTVPSAPNGGDTRSRASSVSSHDTWNSGPSDSEDEPEHKADHRAGIQSDELHLGTTEPAIQTASRTELPASLRAGGPHKIDTHSQPQSDIPLSLRPGSSRATSTGPKLLSPGVPPQEPHSPAQKIGWNNPYLQNPLQPAQPSNPGASSSALPQSNAPFNNAPSQELASLALSPSHGPPPSTQTTADTGAGYARPPPNVPAAAPPPIPAQSQPPLPSQNEFRDESQVPSHSPGRLQPISTSPQPPMLPADDIPMTPQKPPSHTGLPSAAADVPSKPLNLPADDEHDLLPGLPAVAKTAPALTSLSHNPWQEDLDREKEKSAGGKTILGPDTSGQLSGAAAPIPGQPSGSTQAATRLGSPRTAAKSQRNEVYEIRHINWYDALASYGRGAMRISPVMMQNANGPCPLLALVNALTLSTSDSEETSLLQTLRTREQVTLGLLLDAVSEELLRRSEISGQHLPDIGDLYSFLITLHTGMNVNPTFNVAAANQPGGFEQTREMKLYGAFGVPLVHGWTSPFGSNVYQAFERSARSFDEALNLQFLEEELDAKLRSEGLSLEEQEVFGDMTTMKQFLTNYPTQLSDHGLETISAWLQPGQVAILFRNDHFCTLYKEPKKKTLMTLVTDMGYATHDEVVWESLVDVNGARAEFFSGDFRVVGAAPSSRQNSGIHPEHSTLASAGSAVASASQSDPQSTHAVSQAEQEDLDLALALQLQEEEEDASRREAARLQHEQNESLSRQFLERTSQENSSNDAPVPRLPPRRRVSTNRATAAPPQQRMRAADRTTDGSAPPPTYEEAASDMPYREAGSTPMSPRQGNALGALSALDAQRQQSAFTAQNGSGSPVAAPGYGRRRSGRHSYGGPVQQGTYGAAQRMNANGDERCSVM